MCIALEERTVNGYETVSYTHLDVYKRQVQWAVSNRHRAGTCTHTLPDADAMYLPIQSTEEVKGVMGILLEERRPVNDFEYGLLIAMLNETGVKLQDTFCK